VLTSGYLFLVAIDDLEATDDPVGVPVDNPADNTVDDGTDMASPL
jgi:hypothetical protein